MGKKNSNVGWDLHLHIIDFRKQWIYHSFRGSSSSENHLVVVPNSGISLFWGPEDVQCVSRQAGMMGCRVLGSVQRTWF